MCDSLDPRRYPKREVSFSTDDSMDEEEEKIEEAFTKLSAHTISKLIEEEPDSYSIEDVKIRYR